ncbi:MAG: ABC transporter permease, partial [Anaerolineales bacterium]
MSTRHLFAVVRKEIQHIFRDRGTFILVLITPTLVLLLMTYALAVDIVHVPIALLDYDQSALSKKFVQQITAGDDLDLYAAVNSMDQVEDLLTRGKIKAAVIIDPEFSADLLSLQGFNLQVIIDGTEPETGGFAVDHIGWRAEAFANDILASQLQAAGIPLESLQPIDLRIRAWYNPSLKPQVDLLPGLLSIVLGFPAFSVALTLAREHEHHTLEQLLATPITRIELLLGKSDRLASEYGFHWTVTGIADTAKGSVYHPAGVDLARALTSAAEGRSLSRLEPGGCDWDAPTMIQRAEADAMVEVTYTDITTGRPATDHVRAALARGLDVATTNKGPVALAGRELVELAAGHGKRFLFEGTVMAGTPLLNLVRESLAGSKIHEIRGILNGTTNYILTAMEGGMDYAEALARAQELGYAEAVPDADVHGWDALAKVTILANMVLGADLKPVDSPCTGITNITPEHIAAARADGMRYKLIGRVWRDGEAVRASVGPTLVERQHPLPSHLQQLDPQGIGDGGLAGAREAGEE